MNLLQRYILLLPIILLSFSCTSYANTEVRKAIFHTYNDTTYLVLHLYKFHPTKVSYEQGNERVSGYNESILKVYNLKTRKLVVQKYYGPNNNISAIELLGCSDSIIWIYAMQYNSGLQGINLHSLKRQVSQANIYKKMTDWKGSLYNAEWNKINNYYAYSEINKSIIAANYLGNQFYINTQNFKVTNINPAIKLNSQKSDLLSYDIVNNTDTLSITNGKLRVNSNEQLPNSNFIEGAFVLLQNKKEKYYEFLKLQDEYRLSLKNTENTKYWYTQKLDEVKDNIKALLDFKKSDKLLLIDGEKAFFIFSRNDKSEASSIKISKVIYENSNYIERWGTAIPGMFFNIQTARHTRLFKRYFGDFMPQADFIQVKKLNKALIIINQLQVCSLNLENGEINWRFKL